MIRVKVYREPCGYVADFSGITGGHDIGVTTDTLRLLIGEIKSELLLAKPQDFEKEDTPPQSRADSVPTFQPGDVVRLKSGGPKMTVAAIDVDVVCRWIQDNGTLTGASIRPEMLEHEPETEPERTCNLTGMEFHFERDANVGPCLAVLGADGWTRKFSQSMLNRNFSKLNGEMENRDTSTPEGLGVKLRQAIDQLAPKTPEPETRTASEDYAAAIVQEAWADTLARNAETISSQQATISSQQEAYAKIVKDYQKDLERIADALPPKYFSDEELARLQAIEAAAKALLKHTYIRIITDGNEAHTIYGTLHDLLKAGTA